jgi:hypothetical protein
MLKKSLKVGSMLLLIFAMAAFVFVSCDSGSTESEPDDTPSVPVDPDPGNPDPDEPEPPVEETITGVTVTPENYEILAGESYLFKAEVSGTAADKTVIWTVGIADIDFYNKREDGTDIIPHRSGGGLLSIDIGQTPGTVLTVVATSKANPQVSGKATVTVVKPGPRLSWTPNNKAYDILEEGAVPEDAQSVGRLLNIFGKDIRFFEGEYLEGTHYSIRRVDNLNQTLEGGTFTFAPSADEGTLTVSLSGPIVGDKGTIGVTLYPSVLEGADTGLIDLDARGAELVFNLTSQTLITSVAKFTNVSAPQHGVVPPTSIPLADGTRLTGTLTWSGLIGDTFNQESKAVASVVLNAASGYKFYLPNITESFVKAPFPGSPAVSNLSFSESRITFDLTYTITAKKIETYAEANFPAYLRDLVNPNQLKHAQEAPVKLRALAESPLYSLSAPVSWDGLANNKNFVGGTAAVATVTITPKPGYTFKGTKITHAELINGTADPDMDGIFQLGGNANYNNTIELTERPGGAIVSADDSLVFTLEYYIPKTLITQEDIGPNLSVKLPSPVAGIKPVSDLKVIKGAPFVTGGTDSVTWKGVDASSESFKLGLTPAATITLLALPGYVFADNTQATNSGGRTGFNQGDAIVRGNAQGFSPDANGGRVDFNLGDRLVVTINHTTVRRPVDNGSLTALTGPANVIHGLPAGAISFAVSSQIEAIDNGNPNISSSFAWTKGVNYKGQFEYKPSTGAASLPTATATIVVRPKAGYTFFGITNQTIKNMLENQFKSAGATLVTVAETPNNYTNTVTIRVDWTIAQSVLDPDDIEDFFVDFNRPPTTTIKPNDITPVSLLANDMIMILSGSWEGNADENFTSSTDDYTLTIQPRDAGYRFSTAEENVWSTWADSTLKDLLTNSLPNSITVEDTDVTTRSITFQIHWAL